MKAENWIRGGINWISALFREKAKKKAENLDQSKSLLAPIIYPCFPNTNKNPPKKHWKRKLIGGMFVLLNMLSYPLQDLLLEKIKPSPPPSSSSSSSSIETPSPRDSWPFKSYDGEYQYVRFGDYPQDGHGGTESIEWCIIETNEEKQTITLMSTLVLDCIKFGDLNKWLEQDFPSKAFRTSEEKSAVKKIDLINEADTKEKSTGLHKQENRKRVWTKYADEMYWRKNQYTSEFYRKKGYFTQTAKKEKGIVIRGLNGTISYNTSYGRDLALGICPVIVVDVASYTFAEGDGTRDDPFRSLLSRSNTE